jgi:hypothetical protein
LELLRSESAATIASLNGEREALTSELVDVKLLNKAFEKRILELENELSQLRRLASEREAEMRVREEAEASKRKAQAQKARESIEKELKALFEEIAKAEILLNTIGGERNGLWRQLQVIVFSKIFLH